MPEIPPERALRLYPPPTREVEPTAIHSDLPIIPRSKDPNSRRPHVAVNMVASVDGTVAASGKASPIGSGVDRHTMRNLRAGSDAVMVGANTLRAERLSLGLDETSTRARRSRAQPLAVIVTKTGNVPIETNLVFHEGQTVLVLLAGDPVPEDRARALRANATVQRIPATGGGVLDLSWALRMLKRDHGVERLLVEGGPTLNGALISGGLVDELFLTVAPKLLGGPAQEAPGPLLAGTLPASIDLRLLSAHLAADELFLRYSIRGATNDDTAS